MISIHSEMIGIDIIIQARVNATRLPGKTLKPFGEVTVLEYLVDRAKVLGGARRVMVATSTEPQDDMIERLCQRRGYEIFRGSGANVLERYYLAARKLGSQIIARVTADNPFTDFTEMKRMVKCLIDEYLDYISNHNSGMPMGTGSEVFTMKALEKAYLGAKDEYNKEHVTPYFYKTIPELFKQRNLPPVKPYDAAGIRLTLDTKQDYQLLTKIEAAFTGKANSVTTSELINFLRNEQQ